MNEPRKSQALAALGLRSDEEALYRVLVERPSATINELTKALDTDSAEVDRLVASLLAKSLISRTNTAFVATSPALALGPLVRQRRDDLRKAELEMAALTERYWVSAGDRTAGDLVEVVTGVEAIARRFAQLHQGAQKEFRAFVTAHTLVVGRRDSPAEDESVQRGVKYQVVIEREIFEQQGAYADMSGALQSGEEVRVVERVPIKLIISDRNMAMVPMDVKGQAPAALLVHGSGLLEALVALFDAVWERARPLRLDATNSPVEVGADSPLDDEDRQILLLLLAGLTDSSIASQLGLSMRTVQRRVRDMMDLAGVHTRLQLGWHAARANWSS